jgi:hypothetical protein
VLRRVQKKFAVEDQYITIAQNNREGVRESTEESNWLVLRINSDVVSAIEADSLRTFCHAELRTAFTVRTGNHDHVTVWIAGGKSLCVAVRG